MLVTNADNTTSGNEEHLANVRRFLTFEDRDKELTRIHSMPFADNQRNSRLWHHSHHRRFVRQRPSAAVPQPPLHRRPQSPLQIRAPPPLLRWQLSERREEKA